MYFSNAIISALVEFGLIKQDDPVKKIKQRILMQSYVIKKKEGKLLKNYKHLDLIKKGERIAQYDDGEILIAPQDGYILLPNHSSRCLTKPHKLPVTLWP